MLEAERGGFHHLPRELRDIIYDHAFGSTPYVLSHGALSIKIGPRSTSSSTDIVIGLPQWLLTSRDVCSEAVDVLLHTRWISPHFPPRASECPQSVHNATRQQPDIMAICNPARQPLVLYDQSIRNISLDFPSSIQFVRSTWFCNHIKTISHSEPWAVFLESVRPFVAHARLHLELTMDSKSLVHTVPFIRWPEEWASWVEWVDVTLLATEEENVPLRWNAGVTLVKLINCCDFHLLQSLWRIEGVYEGPLPPQHEPRRFGRRIPDAKQPSPVLRTRLRIAAECTHFAGHVQPHC